MSIKKFAMMLFAAGMIYAFSGNVAYASEDANVISETSEKTECNTDLSTENVEASVEQPSEDKVIELNTSPEPATANGKKEKTKAKAKSKAKAKAKKKYSKADLRLMASIINCEAGGESYQGKLAVGIVVMNRVRSKDFPNTVRKVIYQKYQFSPVRNGMLNKKLKQYDKGKIKSAQWKSCISAAKKALSGQTHIMMGCKKKSMKGIKFFSVHLPKAKFRLGGHRFK